MLLPVPLIQIRSQMAQCLACMLRCVQPLSLRLGRFAYEIRVRAVLQGPIAAGVQFIGVVAVEGEGKVTIGPGSRIGRRAFFETYNGAQISIAETVTINDDCVLVAYAGIHIGAKAMIGEKVSIRDADHGLLRDYPIGSQAHTAQAVSIGEDAWIGRGAYVGKGVTIGEGAVVGANSVVTRDVAPYSIVVGAPAKVIGERPREKGGPKQPAIE